MKTTKKRNLVLVPTVDGTLEEVLASMAVQESHANPNNITWMGRPRDLFPRGNFGRTGQMASADPHNRLFRVLYWHVYRQQRDR